MKVFLRFKDTYSLTKYLKEELDKLREAKQRLEEEVRRNSFVDIVEIKDNDLIIRRDEISILNSVLEKINDKINMINSMLDELQRELGNTNYTGLVLLELDNGIPQRILLSQPLSVGEHL